MPEEIEKSIFPKNFLWGASTAGHQVEGGNHNQWTEWEKANAQALAKTAKSRIGHMPAWEEVKKQAQSSDNYISGTGVKHYERHEEDFNLIRQLNLNAFRFSIEWSRLEPVQGQWDEEEILHYHRYIRALKSRGIEPVLNIWHWTHPVWFQEKGAFKHRRNLKHFERFVRKIAEEYGGQIKYIVTLNEPNVYTSHSYLIGRWPPQDKKPLMALRVYWNLVYAHRRAYKILKGHYPRLQIGIAAQLANIQAKRPHNFFDKLSTRLMRYGWNWWFLRRIRHHQDFVGINYYFTDYYNGFFKRQSPKLPLNDLGWYMEPKGLYPVLLRTWARYKKPIIVTENGVADSKDQYRRWWIEETIVAMERAISQGVDVRGYLHWSLLDNFEWAEGWWPKFGLVAVDRQKGMKRTVRESAKWFSERISKS